MISTVIYLGVRTPEEIKAYQTAYRQKKRDERDAAGLKPKKKIPGKSVTDPATYRREWYANRTPEQIESRKESLKSWRLRNLEKSKKIRKDHYQNNKQRTLEVNRAWAAANKDRVREIAREYYRKNPDKIKAKRIRSLAWTRSRHLERYKNDINYRLGFRLRSMLRGYLKRGKGMKVESAESLLGCTREEFRMYLESKFSPEMTWDNIHLDHIRPCASFDLTKLEDQKLCFNYQNIQPMLAKDNMSKGSFWEGKRWKYAEGLNG